MQQFFQSFWFARYSDRVPKKQQAKPKSEPVVLKDPRSIRAIAHPARLKVIDELFQGNIRTATELAQLTGLSPSAMSYHLRALEKWGIVRRADEIADGRERPWCQAGSGVTWDNAATGGELAPVSLIMKQFLDELSQRLAAWQQFEPDAPVEWREKSSFSRGFPWFTPAQAMAFSDGVMKLLKELGAQREADADVGAKRHAVVFAVVPTMDGFTDPT